MTKINDKKNNKTIYNFAISVLIISQIACLVFFAHHKESYHVDEIFTFSLSNSYYTPFINMGKGYFDEWHDGDYFARALMPGEHRFAYDSVYHNQAWDVHPPLHYYIHHTVSSFFPNNFSKWLGIIPNILYYFLVNIVLYLLSLKLFKNKWIALIPCIAWGFSAGAISSVMFIRMYMLKTVFVTWSVYLHYCLFSTSTQHKKYLILIGVCTFLGFMTHYYYLVFAFFISFFFWSYKIVFRKWKEVIAYTAVMLLSLGIGVLHYPPSIDHIFYGYQGTGARSNFISRDIGVAIHKSVLIIDRELFGSFGIWLIVVIIALAIIAFIFKIKISREETCISVKIEWFTTKYVQFKITKEVFIWASILLSCIAYVVIISQIAPYATNRYIFSSYPLIILCFVWGIYYLYTRYSNNVIAFAGITICAFMLISASSYLNRHVDYLYRIAFYHKQSILSENVKHAIFIGGAKDWTSKVLAQELMIYEQLYITDVKSLSSQETIFAPITDVEKIMIYFIGVPNSEDIMETILNDTGFAKYQNFDGRNNVYLLTR